MRIGVVAINVAPRRAKLRARIPGTGTNRVLRAIGRVGGVLGTGLIAYDVTTILLCASGVGL